jgi:signal transduction histidine kinase
MPDTKASILIVDDRPDKVLALEAVLEGLGEDIVRAYSGREALRHVLNQEFAVILLDVNMPGMDGFECASLIRQRRSSEHTPIIFVTAFGDEMHAARGYSLGAVDYILAPVVPEVLRTKVSVFVDLFKKNQQLRRQADWQRRRVNQLQRLAAASIAINGALTIEQMLQTVTETARNVIGAHQGITLYINEPARPGKPPRTQAFTSFSDKYGDWQDRPLHLDAIATTLVATGRIATRMTEHELRDHPDWEIVQRAKIPPVQGGMLAAPLNGRDGANLGVIYLADRNDGDFTSDDEAIIVQLAQMASIAIENTIYAQEREANRIKDEFLATLSHELRTPLNAILGWTQLLRMEELPGDGRHGLDVIERNARAQAKLIEDLLDVSRITTGKLRLTMRETTLAPIVEAAIDAVRPVAEARQIKLEADLDRHVAPVKADPDRLQQVVWNLLSNAVKFTEPGGRVSIALAAHPGRASITVRDTGQGIDPKFLPYVFDRFRQADSTSTRAHGGLGIGLTIVRHIVELHGGSVRAESDGMGHGAAFTAVLPLAVLGGAAATAVGSRGGGAQPAGPRPPSAAAVAALAAAGVQTADGESQRLDGVRVMVVDDEPDTREVVAHILRRAGAVVTTTASTIETLELFSSWRPDVLVSDIAMPGRDGYDLIQTLRRMPDEQGGDTPALALTAYAREEDKIRALAAGYQQHLSKPVEPVEIVAAVGRLTGSGNGAPAMRLAR